MKNLIDSLSIKQKIFLVILIPIFALSTITIFNILDKKESIHKLEYFEINYEYYAKISFLIHAIENERKLAFAYLGSKGKIDKNELLFQREVINDKFKALLKFLNIHDDIFEQKLVNLVKDNIDQLELFRFDVDNLKLFLDIEKNFYTDLIYNLLYSVSNIPALTDKRYLSNQTLAYKHLIEAKEYLSLKEGLTNYIVFANKLTIKDINKLKHFDAFYKNNIRMFKYFVSPDIKDMLVSKKLHKHSSGQKIQNLFYKQLLQEKYTLKKVRDVEKMSINIDIDKLRHIPRAISKKRSVLKKIEDILSKDILKTIKEEKSALYKKLDLYVLSIVLTLFAVFTFGFLISKNIIDKLVSLERELVGFLKYVKREETKFKPLIIKGDDEIAHMAQIVNDGIKETAVYVEQEVKKAKKLHTQMMEAEKMAQMGEMIGNIAHQWRQPLSMISTLATGIHLTKSFNKELSDKELIEKMEKINEYSQYLSETIDTFRDFIKEEKEYKSQTIQDNIKSALDIIGAVLKDVSIELKDNVDYTNLIYVNMVSGELPQVIINLINNSKDIILAQNMENGWIKLDLYIKDDKAVVTVEDNGGGIPPKVMPKIFDPYFTTKHKSQGTGLGLHMSYRIITESIEGRIYADNTDCGAIFFIEIPLSR